MRCSHCATANPPAQERCWKCESALDSVAPLLPPRGDGAGAHRRRSHHRSREERRSRRRSVTRALNVAGLVLSIPMLIRIFGYSITIPPGAGMPGLEPGDRVFFHRSAGSGAAGDVIAINEGFTGAGIAEVVSSGDLFLTVQSGGRTLRSFPASWVVARASFVWWPPAHVHRLKRIHSEI